MAIFKSLAPSDRTIVPFPAYYNYNYTYISGSVNNSIDVAVSYGEKYVDTSINAVRYPNPKHELFDSIVQVFYSDIPRVTYGITSDSFTPEDRIQVISITQDVYGEKVLPGSFSIIFNTSQSYDDGKGNIIASSSAGVGDIVGRIFYDKGIAVINSLDYTSLTPYEQTNGVLDNRGIFIVEGSTVSINFSSSITLYEHAYKVKLNPTEFLYAFNNPTVTSEISGSSKTAAEWMVSQSILLPYVTTIGFYNENNELLMVAKPSVPIQRTTGVTQTFIVKFDV